MTPLVLAAAIALSPAVNHQTQPPAIHQTQAVRQCVWNFHVILCRWRNVQTQPAPKAPTATTTNPVAVNGVARMASDEISVAAANRFAWPAGPASAATRLVNVHPM